MTSPTILIIVDAFPRRDALEEALGLQLVPTNPFFELEACVISKYTRNSGASGTAVTTIFISVIEDITHPFTCKAVTLHRRYGGPTFVFNPSLGTRYMTGMIVNPQISLFMDCLGGPRLGDAEANVLIRKLRGRYERPMTALAMDVLRMSNRPLFTESPTQDPDLDIVIQNSLHDQEILEQRRDALPPAPIPRDWAIVLKVDDSEEEGDGSCVCCVSKRASICFIECGHQVVCDGCAKELKSRAKGEGENVVCPFCRAQVKGIVRPVGPGAAAAAAAQPPRRDGSPPKKRMKNC